MQEPDARSPSELAPVANGTLAARMLQAFERAGTPVVFALPGVHNLAFWRVWGGGARLVGVRHEQATVYAADGFARATGRVGVALTTTGPGAANAVAAFGEAAASGSPVLLVASEVPTVHRLQGAARGLLHESRDQAALFEPLAKAVFRPRSVAEAGAALAEALATAAAFPRGPVYLDVPADMLAMRSAPIELRGGAQQEPLPARTAGERPGDRVAELAALAECLRGTPRILCWAGGGVTQSAAAGSLLAVAERLSAPVVETFAGRGTMPPGHPLRVGLPPHEPPVRELIASAGAMLAVGTDFDGMMTRNWSMALPPLVALVDVDPGRAARNVALACSVRGDAGEVLDALLPLLESRPPWCPPGEQMQARVHAALAADERTAPALELLAALEQAAAAGAVVLADMCIGGYWTAGYLAVPAPRSMQYPMGWGTLGYALPASVGVATQRPAVVVVGDGGAMLALGELATIVQERLPVTVLVLDDAGYGMLRFDQDRAGDVHRGVDLAVPDFVALASAFGLRAENVPFAAEALTDALLESVHAGEPRLLRCEVALFPPRTTSPRWSEP